MKKKLAILLLAGILVIPAGCGTDRRQEGTGTVSVAQSDTEESAPQEADENENTATVQENADQDGQETSAYVTEGTEEYRGFTLDNVLHSENDGDIHFICMCPTAMTEADPMQSFLHYPDMKDYIYRGWEKICTVKTSDSPPGSIIRR